MQIWAVFFFYFYGPLTMQIPSLSVTQTKDDPEAWTNIHFARRDYVLGIYRHEEKKNHLNILKCNFDRLIDLNSD